MPVLRLGGDPPSPAARGPRWVLKSGTTTGWSRWPFRKRPCSEQGVSVTAPDNSRSSCSCGSPKWRWAGASSEPHERCERPELLRCVGCEAVRVKRCGRSSRVACVPCSESYRHRVRRVFQSGWRDDLPHHRVFLLTLTAPGDRAHTLNGRPDGPPCPCTPPGGVHLAEWNGTSGARFNHLVTYLRRSYGDLQYARAAEVQKRGALHFHVLLRTDRPRALLHDYGRLGDTFWVGRPRSQSRRGFERPMAPGITPHRGGWEVQGDGGTQR